MLSTPSKAASPSLLPCRESVSFRCQFEYRQAANLLLQPAARTDAEAQRLYFHIRTLCFWLDAASDMIAIPFLQPYMNKLPFSFGVEAVLGTLLPVAGDIIGFFVSLYVVLLCMQFGLPAASLWKMLVNCIIDVLV